MQLTGKTKYMNNIYVNPVGIIKKSIHTMNSLIKPVSTILVKRSTIAIWYVIGKRNPTVNAVVKDSQS